MDFHDALRVYAYAGALVTDSLDGESAVVIGCMIGSVDKALSASTTIGIEADFLSTGALPSEL